MRIHPLLVALGLGAAMPGVVAQTEIKDADGNTKVQTEKFANENIIRMDLNGSERWVLKRNAAGGTQIELPNNGENLFFGNFAGAANALAGTQNTFIGSGAGGANTSGNQNTFVGQGAGSVNTTGQQNTFIGKVAGAQTSTGNLNTFVGESAGVFNTSGSFNTFLGQSAGNNNTTASENTYIGASSGANSLTGQLNTFVGAFTGQSNSASTNTFIGHSAGKSNTLGTSNTFLGRDAGRANLTAGNNTLLGHNTGKATTSGGSNTMIGESAGLINTTGNGNVFVGKNAGDSHAANVNCTFLGNGADAQTLLSGLNNATALGNGAVVNANNKIRLGNTSVLVIEGQVAYTTSDGRFKKEVKQDAPGLDFILGLRPVTYHFDYTGFSDFLQEENTDKTLLQQKEQKREMGFIAQEVEQLCAKQGIDIANLVHAPESELDNYSVAYGQIVVPLVKAIQEQQAEINELKTMVAQLMAAQNQSLTAPVMDMQVWPNPAGSVIQIAVSGVGKQANLELLSANGAVLQSLNATEGVHTMNIENLPAGMYYVKMNTQGKMPMVKSIVKSGR